MYLHSNMEGQQRSVGDTTALLNERHAFVIQSGHRTELELVLSPLFWHFYLAYMYIAKSFFRGKLYLLVLNWWTFLLLHLQRQLFFSHGWAIVFCRKIVMKLVFFMETKENQLEFGINGKFLTNSGDHSQKNAWIFGSWTPLTVATNWNFCISGGKKTSFIPPRYRCVAYGSPEQLTNGYHGNPKNDGLEILTGDSI